MASSGSEQKPAQQQQQVPLTRHEQQGKACSHCGAGSSSNWNRHPTTGARLCSACWTYLRRHGGQMRPVGVQCLQCGGDSPGPRHNATWRPHPVSGEGWLCSPCFAEVRRQHDPLLCSHCGAGSSSNWNRHPTTGARLCSACRTYMSRHGGQMRPVGVQCLQCGGDSPGPQHSATWRPHPASGEGWLCSPCFAEVRRQLDPPLCSHCGAGRSGKWNRHPTTGARLCDPCRGYMSRHGGQMRPVGVQCLQCGGDSPGPQHSATWRPHPVSGDGWLCSPCFFEVRRQLDPPLCSHCGAGRSGKWNRNPTTGARLCDPCRGYMSRHGGQMRPVGVQCLQCGGDSPGPQHSATWRPHPVSGDGWLCSPCFFEVRRQTDVRRCLECGAGRSAPGKATGWCRHPVTGEEWLCGTCYGRVRYRRQEGEEAEADGEAMPRPATKKQRQEQEQQQQQLQLQPQQQQQPQPQPQPQPQQGLLGVLLEAAGTPAGAAGGLTSELAASFCAVFDTLRPDQQAAKVRGVWALLCMLGARKSTAFASCCLALGLHAMRAGLQGVAASREAARWRAPPPPPRCRRCGCAFLCGADCPATQRERCGTRCSGRVSPEALLQALAAGAVAARVMLDMGE